MRRGKVWQVRKTALDRKHEACCIGFERELNEEEIIEEKTEEYSFSDLEVEGGVFSHVTNCEKLITKYNEAFLPRPSDSPTTRILLLISMAYKTLFINFEEKNILKDLVIQNNAKIYSILDIFEHSHTLYSVQEQFRLLLTSLSENLPVDSGVHASIPLDNIQIRQVPDKQKKWIQKDTVLIRLDHGFLGDKVISFDIDCLVTCKSGRKIPLNDSDWTWKYPTVPHRIVEYHNNGYSIAIFTNQSHIESKWTTEGITFMKRIENIIERLYKIPICVFAAIRIDYYQKPQTSLWDLLAFYYPDHHREHVFHIGELAGRKGDASCEDRLFAMNLAVPFQTGSEFFTEERPQIFSIPFSPSIYFKNSSRWRLGEYIGNSKQEFFIIVGSPSSGKTLLADVIKRNFGVSVINFDVEDDVLLLETIENGKSIVVDGNFPSILRRQNVCSLARRNNIPCSCFLLDIPIPLAKHLNALENRTTLGKQIRYPESHFALYEKQYQPPSDVEGFTNIIKLRFTAEYFSVNQTDLFGQYLCS